jgi:hypothetical protein
MTAATTWELNREHEEFRASVRAFSRFPGA